MPTIYCFSLKMTLLSRILLISYLLSCILCNGLFIICSFSSFTYLAVYCLFKNLSTPLLEIGTEGIYDVLALFQDEFIFGLNVQPLKSLFYSLILVSYNFFSFLSCHSLFLSSMFRSLYAEYGLRQETIDGLKVHY